MLHRIARKNWIVDHMATNRLWWKTKKKTKCSNISDDQATEIKVQFIVTNDFVLCIVEATPNRWPLWLENRQVEWESLSLLRRFFFFSKYFFFFFFIVNLFNWFEWCQAPTQRTNWILFFFFFSPNETKQSV